MKKYTFTFLGISLLALLSGCNTTSTESSNAQSKKDLNLEFSKAAAEVATMSSELIATTDTTTALDNFSTDSTTTISSDSTSSSSSNDIQEASSTIKEKESISTNPEKDYSSSTDDNQKKKITSITETQKETLIAFTKQDCEDRGYKLKYRGKDTWNVAVNYINNKNRWIVTCNDANYGRVKAIYEWDGEENSGASLIYLLISGNELMNKLNN
ncbi:lipoprotein [Enterococcus faecalis]|uniref:lipoprotein n=1 Tax=Enterococcus TaxID=1350 RepID=UPI000ACFCADB|nr:lipoprotein [Enterococcus faecalis]